MNSSSRASRAATPPRGAAGEGVHNAPKITEQHTSCGSAGISTVYAYYTSEQKAAHGKHCERWANFGHLPETEPYRTGKEREFIAKIDVENRGKFSWYLISWSGCD